MGTVPIRGIKMAFDRFNDKPARRENRFSDRGPREDRFGGKREFGDRKDFGESSFQ